MKLRLSSKKKTAILASLLVVCTFITQFSSILGQTFAADTVIPEYGDVLYFEAGNYQLDGHGVINVHTVKDTNGQTVDFTGKVYCIDYHTAWSNAYREAVPAYQSDYFNSFTKDQQEMLILVQLYGSPNRTAAEMGIVSTGGLSSEDLAGYVTQVMMWEVTEGYRTKPSDNIPALPAGNTRRSLYKQYIEDSANGRAAYMALQNALNRYAANPSFISEGPFEMEYNSTTKRYEITLTDTNNTGAVLEVVGANSDGVKVIQDGNKYTFYAESPSQGSFAVKVCRADIPKAREETGPPTVWEWREKPTDTSSPTDRAIQRAYSGTEDRSKCYELGFKAPAGPSVKLVKEADPHQGALIMEGDPIVYTIKVTNTGRSVIKSYQVYDPIPAHVTFVRVLDSYGGTYNAAKDQVEWTLKDLEPGETRELKFEVKANAMGPAECPRFIINIAYGEDGEHSNETEHEQCASFITGLKTADPEHGSTVKEGDKIKYTITVYNSEGQIAKDVKIRDIVPDGTTLVPGSISDGGTLSGREINWTIARIGAGEKKSVTFEVTVDALEEGVPIKTIINRAYINDVPTNDTVHFVYGHTISGSKLSDPVSGSIVKPGQTIKYTITVRNNGAGIARDVVVRDQIPAGTTYKASSAAPSSWFVGASNGMLEWKIPLIDPGKEAKVTFEVTVDALPTNVDYRVLKNSATVNNVPTNETEHYVYGPEIVGVKKSNPPTGTTVYEGDEITYFIDVHNLGAGKSGKITVTDQIPDNTELIQTSITGGSRNSYNAATRTITWEIDELDAGRISALSFKVKVKEIQYGTPVNEIRNVAYVNGLPTNETEHVQYPADIVAVKRADPVENTIVSEGDRITYSIEILNAGADTAYKIPFLDQIPAGTTLVDNTLSVKDVSGANIAYTNQTPADKSAVKLEINEIKSGQKVIVSFAVLVGKMPANLNERDIVNTAQVGGSNTNSTTHRQTNYKIAGVKSSDPITGTTVYEGSTITYFIEVFNRGSDVSEPTTVTDQIPDNTELVAGSNKGGTSSSYNAANRTITWQIGPIQPGKSTKVEFTVEVKEIQFGVPKNEIHNVAYVDGKNTNQTVHFQYPKNITALKRATKENSFVTEGDVIQYTVEVYNGGADTAHNITVQDVIPEGTTWKSLDGVKYEDGSNVTYTDQSPSDHSAVKILLPQLAKDKKVLLTFSVTVGKMPTNLEYRTIVNKAQVNDFYTNEVKHHQTNYEIAGIKRSEPGDNSQVHEGEKIKYFIDVVNTGADTAKNVKVVDVVPAGTTYRAGTATTGGNITVAQGTSSENGRVELTWTIKELAPGEKVTVSFEVDVNNLPEGDLTGKISNQAYINTYPTNVVEHDVKKDMLQYTKESYPEDGSAVKEGQIIQYRIVVQNDGNMKSRKVVVTDVVPAGTTLVDGSISHGGVLSGGTIKWEFDTIAVGQKLVLTFEVKVNELEAGQKSLVIKNKALIDGEPTNETEHTVKKPVLEFEKDSDPKSGTVVSPGGIITYTIVLRNIGTLADENLRVTDLIPAGTTYVRGSAQGTNATATYQSDLGQVVWDIARLEAGGTAYLTFQVKVSPLAYGQTSGKIKNQAVVYGYDVDGEKTNEVEHNVQPNLVTIFKSASPPDGSEVNVGNQIIYYLDITNNSGDLLEYVPVWDSIPEGLTYVGASASDGGELNEEANRVEWVIPSLAPGATHRLSFKVTANDLPEGVFDKTVINVARVGEGGTKDDPGTPNIISNEVEHKIVRPVIEPKKTSVPPSGTQVYIGDTIEYTITLHNNSDETVRYVPVKDEIPEGTTYVNNSANPTPSYYDPTTDNTLNWVIPSIGPGEDVEIKFSVTVDALPPGQNSGQVDNIAFCGNGGTSMDNPGEANIATDVVTHIVILSPVEGKKSSDPASGTTVQTGQKVTYYIDVKNIESVAVYNVPVYDEIPAGTTYYQGSAKFSDGSGFGTYDRPSQQVRWTIPTIEAGETVRVEFAVIVDELPGTATTGYIRNLAYVGGSATNEVTHDVNKSTLYGVKTSNPVSGSRVIADQTVTYTITVHNDTATAATNVRVRDQIPAGATYIDNSAQASVGTYADGQVTWTIASIPAGGTAQVSFQVSINPLPAGQMQNTIVNAAFVNDLRTNEVEHTLYQTPYYGVKTSDPKSGSVVAAGQEITYSIYVKNDDVVQQTIRVTDPRPNGVTIDTASISDGGSYNSATEIITWPEFVLQPGADKTLTFKVTVDNLPGAGQQRVIQNQAFINSTPTNVVEHKQYSPILSATKDSDPVSGSRVRVGDTITYKVRVKNTGSVDAETVNIVDHIPRGTTYVDNSCVPATGGPNASKTQVEWNLGELKVGEEVEVTFQVTVDKLPASMADGRVITNVAIVNGILTNRVTHDVKAPVIHAEKTASPPHGSDVREGQVIRYFIKVENLGGVSGTNIRVRDVAPQNTTPIADSVSHQNTHGGKLTGRTVEWTIPVLEAGQSVTLSFSVMVNDLPEGLESRVIKNVGYYGQPGEEPETPTDEVLHNVNKAKVVAKKFADPESGTPVTVGSIITYTIELKNEGTMTARNTYIYDNIPAGTTYVRGSLTHSARASGAYNDALNRMEFCVNEIPAGATDHVSFQVRVLKPAEGAGTTVIRNVAQVNGKDTEETEHEVILPAITAEKTAQPPSGSDVNPGDEIRYIITVTNNSDQEAKFVPVSDVIPEGTTYKPGSATGGDDHVYFPADARLKWVIGSIPANDSAELEFTVTVDALPAGMSSRTIVNYALYGQGGESTTNPGPTDTRTNETIHNVKSKLISGEKTAVPKSTSVVKVNDKIEYKITVRNFGPTAAENVVVSDVLPAELMNPVVYDDGEYDPTTRTITWVIPSIAALTGEAVVRFDATVAPLTSGETNAEIRNVANVDGKETNRTIHYVNEAPNMEILKTSTPGSGSTVQENSTITYKINVTNRSTQAANNVVVTDPIPAGTTFVAGSQKLNGAATGGSPANGVLRWNLGTMAAGATAELEFQVTVNPLAASEAGRTIRNKATVTSSLGTEESDEVVHIVPDPGPGTFDVLKTATPPSGQTVYEKETIEYTIRVTNNTTGPMANVVVRDDIPAGTTHKSGGTLVGNTVEFTIDYIAPGEFEEVSFSVTVNELPEGTTRLEIWNQAFVTSGSTTRGTNKTVHYAQPDGDEEPREVNIKKTADPVSGTTVLEGSTITYFIDVTNNTEETVNNITVTDAIPAGTTYKADSAKRDGAANGTLRNGELVWEIASLAAGASTRLSFEVTVNDLGKLSYYTIINQARMTYGLNVKDSDRVWHLVVGQDDPDPTDPVTIRKVSDPANGSQVEENSFITYTLVVANTSGETLSDVLVFDTIPAGVTFISQTPSREDIEFTNENGRLEWMIASLAANETVNIDIRVQVKSGFAGSLVNIGYVKVGDKTIPSDPVIHYPKPATSTWETRKWATPASGLVEAGQEITYYVQVRNTGSTTLNNFEVTDMIPYGTTFAGFVGTAGSIIGTQDQVEGVTWNIGTLAPNSEVTMRFKVTVDALPDGVTYREIRNRAVVKQGDSMKETGDTTHEVGKTPDPTKTAMLSAAKSASPAAGTPVAPGQEITYTINVTNYGTAAASNVVVSDRIPTGTEYVSGGTHANGVVTFTIPTIAAGATVPVSFKVKVATDTTATMIYNVATVRWDDKEVPSTPVIHPVVEEYTDVYAEKTSSASSYAPVKPGSTLTYTIRLENRGNKAAHNVPVTDRVPTNTTFVTGSQKIDGETGGSYNAQTDTVSWNIDVLEPGAVKLLTFQVTVDTIEDATEYWVVRNQAFYGQGGDTPTKPTNPVEDPVSDDLLHAVKTANPASGSEVKADQEITYTITVTNQGDTEAKNAIVTDRIPDGMEYVAGSGGTYANGVVTWTIASIAAGESAEVSFKAKVLPLGNASSAKMYRNTPYVNGVPGTPTDHVQYPPSDPTDNIVGSKSAEPASGTPVQPGQTLSYTITMQNRGTTAQTGIVVTDKIPSGTTYKEGSASDGGTLENGVITWKLDLAAGQTKELKFQVTVNAVAGATQYWTVRNQAHYTQGSGDPSDPTDPSTPTKPTNPVENPVTDASLFAVKTADPRSGSVVQANQEITYTITVTNSGETEAKDVVVTDRIPDGMEYVAGSGGTHQNGVVTFTIPTIAAGGTEEVSFKVKVEDLGSAQTYRVYHNTPYVNDTPGVPTDHIQYPENDPSDSIVGNKTAQPAAGQPVTAGQTITYTITMQNRSDKTERGIVVTDQIPANTTYVDGSASDGGELENGTITWTLNLGAGETKDLTFQVTVNKVEGATQYWTVRNQAYYTQGGGDDPSDPSDPTKPTKPTNPVENPVTDDSLFAVKSADPGSGSVVKANQEITYTITVHNLSDSEAKNAVVTDRIPAGTEYVSGSGGTYQNGVVTFTIPSIPAGETKAVSFKVKVLPLGNVEGYQLYHNTPYVNDAPGTPTDHIQHPEGGGTNEGIVGRKSAQPPSGSPVVAGQTITYSIEVENKNTKAETGIVVTDKIPSGTTYKEGTASDGGTLENGVITWKLDLEAGQKKAVSFQVTVNDLGDVSYRTIRNVAVVAGKPSTGVEHQQIPPVLDVEKQSSIGKGQKVSKGNTITYYITLKNRTSATVYDINITDAIPEGTTYVRDSAKPEADYSNKALKWTIASLGAYQSVTVEFQVTVDNDTAGTIRNVAYVNDAPSNTVVIDKGTNAKPPSDNTNGNSNITVNVNGDKDGNGSNGSNGSSGNNGSSGSNGSGNYGSAPKTGEANANWAIILLMLSSGLIAVVLIPQGTRIRRRRQLG